MFMDFVLAPAVSSLHVTVSWAAPQLAPDGKGKVYNHRKAGLTRRWGVNDGQPKRVY